ncbi:Fe-S cluster assembly protein SufD [Leptolyngbya sp. FACHB-261]|uniref:Fe-S cluster assembly protein SufD n=1 Tax=Leptolyngbya sp. FACHB-261 TaxID=2692806 RepID=UPI0016892FD1|nr:Fe-S cluster assembly protein SufD [Leptolyngbya sp. FACHB-261]MBD2101857.1 Fe-S cluster assembly protein SufD [Leptolyngbya sp. FACHB-261]
MTQTIAPLKFELDTAEPQWLQAVRQQGFEFFDNTPLPTRKPEEWRYSHRRLERVLFREFDYLPASDADLSQVQWPAELKPEAVQVVFINGHLAKLDAEQLNEAGAKLLPIEQALKHPKHVLEQSFGQLVPPTQSHAAAFHYAFSHSGVHLYVPRNTHLEQPIQIVHWVDRPRTTVLPHLHVVAEQGSQVTVIEWFLSPEGTELICSHAAEIDTGDNAQVLYSPVQLWGSGASHLSHQFFKNERDSRLQAVLLNLGGDFTRLELSTEQATGADARVSCAYLGGERQHFDHQTKQIHSAPHATSNLDFKGALTGKARSVYRGSVFVKKAAQLTNAYQLNNNLILSEGARADSTPSLEIEADDVKCSHGATVGQIDPEQVLYLMARGIPKAIAEQLIVRGYLAKVIDLAPTEAIRAAADQAINRKLY